MTRPLTVIILAAGRGTRMKTQAPKVLFDVCGLPALAHVVRAARALLPERIVLVVSKDGQEACLKAVASDPASGEVECVIQDPPLGTGHAVQRALGVVDADQTDLLVVYGDGPLIRSSSLERLYDRHCESGAGASLLTANVDDPSGLGRVVRDGAGQVARIVEELDADDATRAIREVNTGILGI